VTVKTALWELQTSVYEKLNGNAVLKQLITDVYDEVNETAVLPYVQIGDDTVAPYDTKTTNGEDLTLTIHCFANGPGKREAKLIMDAVLQALTSEPLTVTGFNVDGLPYREFLEVFSEGSIYHGVCRFRVYVKQI
jgi:hypothetical protein